MSSLAIPAAVVVTVGLAETDKVIHKQGMTIRPVIGGFILGLFLYAISSVDAQLGSLFALLVVLNSAIEHASVFGKIAGTSK